MKSDIAETLRSGEGFRAVRLPIYRLADQKLVGYEMLSRGPKGPLSTPDEFFRLSIKHKVLTEVDLHCLEICLEATKGLKAPFGFHINLFPSTIMETPIDKLLKMFPKNRKPGDFCVEIVEQQKISDTGSLHDKVLRLKDAGIRLAMDDVGFGASSLESLIVLEPDIIKIDRLYVTGASEETRREKQLRRLVKVAEALDAELVAEGISSKQDLALLKQVGVGYGQGIFWGPLP